MAKRTIANLTSLGKHLREERISQGLSQTELAEIAGVSLNFVSQLESGKPTVRFNKVFAVMESLGLRFALVYREKAL